MARRHADHQPPDPALAHRGELAGHDLDMPAHRKADARVELEKSTRRKARKIAPEQRGALFCQGNLDAARSTDPSYSGPAHFRK